MHRVRNRSRRVPYIPYQAILILVGCVVLGGVLSWLLFPRTEVVTEQVTVAVADPVLEEQLHDALAELERQTSLAEALETENAALVAGNNRLEPIGKFDITAYCSCVKCCEEWALTRPVVNGHEIVFTASGAIAEQGVTIAVDPEVIPYGTKVYIEGVGVRVAQDCGGAIKGNRIDVYYSSHEDAWNSGVTDRPRQVWIINEEE